ncbi:PhzF family phenazine biosynthesis protein [Evansella sp. LMS18]|jgi:PhzF family phenazine biosynthesis protein|uniref:PhzF family phenazine biosynthesis protein n=1 Tax=Evansella sp. LMS18 TaxID=2924033 RepID=UPI0020D01F36|nr:PhzF family phenazine biosynthesis protein [Evansella sp. LMS18]UTR09998.1 PhzF family phenazine biosynthesis protein [Evansella sp. LMS18]
MKLPIYQIDAFTNEQFKGNYAAVCPLEKWISDDLMQKIAAENNLPETSFFVKEGEGYGLRWFTPTGEIDLCGHATLASAFVIFTYLDKTASEISFSTKSGLLEVTKEDDLLTLLFPSRPGEKCDAPEELIKGLGKKPLEVYKSRDYMAVFETEQDILNLNPDMSELKKLDAAGVIVTAKGTNADFVSRFFAPRLGIEEDPVTGSTHCTLVPYWKQQLGKNEFKAKQLSERGGKIYCTDLGDKIKLAGQAVTYLEGYITIS